MTANQSIACRVASMPVHGNLEQVLGNLQHLQQELTQYRQLADGLSEASQAGWLARMQNNLNGTHQQQVAQLAQTQGKIGTRLAELQLLNVALAGDLAKNQQALSDQNATLNRQQRDLHHQQQHIAEAQQRINTLLTQFTELQHTVTAAIRDLNSTLNRQQQQITEAQQRSNALLLQFTELQHTVATAVGVIKNHHQLQEGLLAMQAASRKQQEENARHTQHMQIVLRRMHLQQQELDAFRRRQIFHWMITGVALVTSLLTLATQNGWAAYMASILKATLG